VTHQYDEIELTKDGRVTVLAFNRPEKLNALTPRAFWYEIPSALEEVAHDDEVRVLIITGRGRGFSSGADVGALAEIARDPTQSKAEFKSPEPRRPRYYSIHLLRNLPKPTIAAVNGIAAGAGLSFALACDIRIASEDARFSSVFIRRGLVPDHGLTFFLPRLVGTAKALELMYTGDVIDAQQAERIGLVNHVVPAKELMPAVMKLADRIAKNPPIAVALTKRIAYHWLEQDLISHLEYEAYNQRLCRDTQDFKEAVRAFQEKREPEFRGT
jgi:2-(1,2-epoxy-1,2-dihydrophenyl)acetyl-CoA isomerase